MQRANVTYIADSIFSVEVIAQQAIHDRLNVAVQGTTLKVDYKLGTSPLVHEPISIIVHAPTFTGAKVTGSGDLNVPSKFTVSSLSISISGSGSAVLSNVDCTNAKYTVTGSGSLKHLAGITTAAEARVSGSGSIDMLQVPCSTADAHVSGSGDIKVFVNTSLDATISGSGTIYLRGTPQISKQISGSGEIVTVP
jgi:hypothetical protein